MSKTTKTLIAATVAITEMDRNQMQSVLLDILASNPSVIFGAMNIAAPATTFKVVLDSYTNNKISIIKMFREATGAGLADSKAWCEGETYEGRPAGAFAVGLTREEADRITADMNHKATNQYVSNGYSQSPTGLKVKVVRDTDSHDYRSLVSWAVDKGPFAR